MFMPGITHPYGTGFIKVRVEGGALISEIIISEDKVLSFMLFVDEEVEEFSALKWGEIFLTLSVNRTG